MSILPFADTSAESLRPRVVAPYRAAIGELVAGFACWRIWLLLGSADIRQRYRRSTLGQFWLTLSMAIFVGSIGMLYSILLHVEISDYLPYLATHYVMWTFFTGVAVDSTTALSQGERMLRQQAFPLPLFVLRVIVRHLIILAHNLPVALLTLLIFRHNPGWALFAALPGLALALVGTFLLALALAIVCTRFRDLPQIVQQVVQILFFITPITWMPDQLGANGALLVMLNPVASILRVSADPLAGTLPPVGDVLTVILIDVFLAAVVFPLFVRTRSRVAYWL